MSDHTQEMLLLHRTEQLQETNQRLAAAEEREAKLVELAIFTWGDPLSWDGSEIPEKFVELGLAKQIDYDPEEHSDMIACEWEMEAGDPLYILVGWLQKAWIKVREEENNGNS